MARDGHGALAQRTRTPFNTAALTTAGGLAFVGDWDRHFYAYDAQTDAVLWQTRTPTSRAGLSHHLRGRGRQYLAVPVWSGRRQLDVARFRSS